MTLTLYNGKVLLSFVIIILLFSYFLFLKNKQYYLVSAKHAKLTIDKIDKIDKFSVFRDFIERKDVTIK